MDQAQIEYRNTSSHAAIVTAILRRLIKRLNIGRSVGEIFTTPNAVNIVRI